MSERKLIRIKNSALFLLKKLKSEVESLQHALATQKPDFKHRLVAIGELANALMLTAENPDFDPIRYLLLSSSNKSD